MSINTEIRQTDPKLGNGTWVDIPFTFKVFETSDIKLVRTTDLGVESVLVEGSGNDYTVVLNTDQDTSPGGTITLTAASTTNYLYTAESIVPNLQPVVVTNLGGFFPNVFNTALDRVTILIQQVLTKVGRAIEIPISDGSGVTTTLPTKTLRANKALVFDASGNVGVSTEDFSDQGATNAAASAAAALVSQNAAETAEGNAETAETNAQGHETAAAASAASAAAIAAAIQWQDVLFLTNADSPVTIGQGYNGYLIVADTSGGDIVINLPTVASLTTPYLLGVKKETSDTNVVTINRSGTDEFANSATSLTISGIGGKTLTPDNTPSPDRWVSTSFGQNQTDVRVDLFVAADTDYVPGTTTQLTLTAAPGSANNAQVFFDGVYQEKSEYSLVGSVLTFTSAIPLGVSSVEVTYGTALEVGTPSDGTVSFVKLASSVIASVADMVAGTASKILTAANFKTYVDTYLVKRVVTAAQTLSNNTVHTFTHTLGKEPQNVVMWLVCTTANNGYVIGDKIKLVDLEGQAGSYYGATSYVLNGNTTEVKVHTGAPPIIRHATAATNHNANYSNFECYLEVQG